MKAKPKRSKIIKDCDKLWSKVVRQRDGNECVIEGCHADSCHAHHVFSRKNISVRFDISNGISLCFKHHFHWAHTNYEEFRDFIIGWMGKKEFELLKAKSNLVQKWSVEELLTIKDQLSRLIDK
jgi:hypothetical protein